MLIRAFHRVVLARRWLTFLTLVVSFLIFGAGSLNLVYVLKANVDLVLEYGMQALADGAARQFVEIIVTACISMAAYVIFKACEHALVHGLLHANTETPKEPHP